MVVLMGGRGSQGYNLFVQLTVKAFMSIRPYANQIVDTVHLMLGTGLPSFKGEGTIKRLRERFALGLTERQAAEWMMGVIRNAHENARSILYDEFQRVRTSFLSSEIHRSNRVFYVNSYRTVGRYIPVSRPFTNFACLGIPYA
jgi:phosphatidylinositol kinase/protein kinase (PI-3  family)